MAVKLFFKHLFRSIRLRPAQPMLLIVVLALAVTMSIATFDIDTYLRENSANSALATSGTAEYAISVNSQSSTRFILMEKAKEVLPEGVDMCGTYALPMNYGESHDFVLGVATDFDDATTIFSFNFIDYKAPTAKQIKNAVYVTAEFASNHGLSMGDNVVLSSLGKDMSFQIYGISDKKYMGTYSAMFSTKALAYNLGKDSLFITMLGDDFSPAGTIYVKAGSYKGDLKAAIGEAFPDMSITDCGETANAALNGMENVILIMVVATVFFAIIVLYCCFHIISAKRAEETDLFYSVGAKAHMLYIISAVEIAVYWAIGSAIGIGLSLGVGKIIIAAADLTYCMFMLHAKSVVVSLACMFVAAECSLGMHFAVQSIKKLAQKRKKIAVKHLPQGVLFGIVATIAIILSTLCCTVVPMTSRIYVGIACLVFICLATFFAGKFLIKFVCKRRAEKVHSRVHLRYAMKNAQCVPMLGNITGLVALALTTMFIATILMLTAVFGVENNKIFLKGDYLVLNASESSKELLEDTDGVENVYSLYKEYIDLHERLVMVLSIDDTSALHKGFGIERLPVGNEAFLCKPVADIWGIKVNDIVKFNIGNKEFEVVITDLLESNNMFLIVDADYLDIAMNYTLVEGEDGFNKEQLYANIMETLEFESASVIDRDEFTNEWVGMLSSYIVCAELIVVFIVIFAIIGISNSMVSSYRSRRDEFDCYSGAGMNKKALRAMKSDELLITFGLGIIIFFIVAVPTLYLIHKMCQSIGTVLAWSWKEYFLAFM